MLIYIKKFICRGVVMQRYFVSERDNDCLVLSDNDLHHIRNVMRMKNGEEIECVYDGCVYICDVIDTMSNRVVISSIKNEDNELSFDITVGVALVKEQKFDLILQKLTELGVRRIVPVKMERSIVKLDDGKRKKKLERWQMICKEASEQSKRNFIPKVMDVVSINELSKFDVDNKFVCSTRCGAKMVNNYLQNIDKCAKMLFVIGPEGGISDNEEAKLNDLGFVSVSLGNRVLRVETAAIYVASILSYCSMG